MKRKFNKMIEEWLKKGYSLDRAIYLTLVFFDLTRELNVKF
jgi:hypothetical protein